MLSARTDNVMYRRRTKLINSTDFSDRFIRKLLAFAVRCDSDNREFIDTLIESNADGADPTPRFWELLAEAAKANLKKEPESAPEVMTEQQAIHFENEPMEVGKEYYDWPIGRVPSQYLCLFETETPFIKKLRRYLRSDRFRRRQALE